MRGLVAFLLAFGLLSSLGCRTATEADQGMRISVLFPSILSKTRLDGRMLLMISTTMLTPGSRSPLKSERYGPEGAGSEQPVIKKESRSTRKNFPFILTGK